MQRRILIVDDEERMADSLKQLLENYDFQVDVAYGGDEAIKKIDELPVDVVITDIKMAEIDGFDVMRHIQEKTPSVYTIVITGHPSAESAIEALHQKAFDYITKPFDFDLLKASVDKAFAHLEAQRFREDMINMIAHDIRAPINSISNYMSLVYDKETDKLHPKAREYLDQVKLNCQEVINLIENFLTSCKIESGQLMPNLSHVDVNFIIGQILATLGLEADRKKITIEQRLDSSLPIIRADENLIYRSICNLIDNAIKFTPEGEKLEIVTIAKEAQSSLLKTDSVIIEVSNTGPGIQPQELSVIFEKFKRGASACHAKGVGMGLFIVKCVAEAHQGKVLVASIPDSITIFSLCLPVKPKDMKDTVRP